MENGRSANHLVRCQPFDIEAKYGRSTRHWVLAPVIGRANGRPNFERAVAPSNAEFVHPGY